MTNYQIRKSIYDDIDRMLEIYEDARAFMETSGNPNQWIGGYPERDLLIHDIENGNSYVCVDGSLIVGIFYYEEGEEPTYKEIYEGQWLDDKSYGVVHRIASARDTKGVGEFCLNWCYDQLQNVRIDTHRDNIPMQRLLTKLGYKICGIIYVEDGSERIAFQKTPGE